jgi:hypothetical protein
MNYSEKPYSLRFKGPECGNIECNTPEAFAEAWVLLKKLFNRSGASKVKFSFNVSCGSEIKTTNGNTIGGEPEQRDFHKIDTKRENPILSAVQWIGKKEAAYGLTPGSSIQMVGIHAYSATYSFNNQAEVDWFNKAYDHRSAPLKFKDNPGPEFSQLLEAGISFFRRAGLESGDRPLIIGESGVDRGPSKSAQANKSAYLEKMGEDAKKYRVSLLNYFDSNRDTARGRPGGQWALTVSQRRTLSDSLSDF